MFTLYIFHSKSLGRYYIGYTNNIKRRLAEHNRKKGKYTDAGIPWDLVYSENFETKAGAMQREKYVKSRKSKSYIKSLIRGTSIGGAQITWFPKRLSGFA